MRNLCLAGTLVLVTLSPTVAFSQGTATGGTIDEIVVTSQRREQSLQEVPISVTAFTGDQLDQQNITGAVDFLALTPNVSFTEDGQFGKRGLGISIRGINNLVSGENASINSVGVYLDEFSVASVPNQVANPFLPDMERIEVLRGPQGTYFGRNSLGGALNMKTRDPGDELEARVTVGAESYDDAGEMFNITGVLSGPLGENFKLRGVLKYEDSDGTVENICKAGNNSSQCPIAAENSFTPNGAEGSGHEYFMGRLKAIWDISDAASLSGTFIYTNEEQDTDENVPSGVLDLDTVDTFAVGNNGMAYDPGTGFWPMNRNKLAHDLQERSDLETIVAIANFTYNLNDTQTIKWITGIVDAEFDRKFDNDLIGGADLIGRTNMYDGTSWSTELRFQSEGDRADWVVGVLYAQDEQNQRNNVAISSQPTATVNGDGFLPPFPEGLGLALNTKSFEVEQIAIFADLTYTIGDRLDLIIGGRYTHDEVDDSLQAFGIGGPGGPPTFVNSPRPSANGSESFDDFAPRFGARYQFTDDVGGYVTISKGYKAGGSSLGNDTNNNDVPIEKGFKEEILWNYEVGLKTELFDNTLRLNGAVFYLEWEDLQFEAFRFLTPGDLSSNFEQTINIDDAEAYGIELEGVWAPTENLLFTGGLGWIDTEITKNVDPETGLDFVEITGGFRPSLTGLEIPKAPELTFNLAGELRLPIAENELWFRLEYIHRDGQYSDIEGLTNLQTRGPSPNQGLVRVVGPGEFPYRSPDYDVVNIRAGFDMEQWQFSLFVQNAGDEEYYTGTQENFGLSGIRLRPHPLTIGGSVTFRYGGN
ncbi:MAG: TonB-dependent receptor [Gammaproteobacteria bacterium]|nr:TonB-dependent receptor [Gammaproteobacteria bacterium]